MTSGPLLSLLVTASAGHLLCVVGVRKRDGKNSTAV